MPRSAPNTIRKLFAKKANPAISSYTSNPGLLTVAPDYPGTPLDQYGRFINAEIPTVSSLGSVLKFITQKNPQKAEKKKDQWRIEVLKNEDWLTDPSDKIVWLGHASFFIRLAGKRLLIDPVFGALPLVKRYSELPLDPENFRDIDYILVSHAHYDHCDKSSLKLLAAHNPGAQIVTGLNLNKLISKWLGNPVQAAGWYQQYKLDDTLKITFVPSRHWANRNLSDINTTLWGGFIIESKNKTIYYGGDSGYGAHFKTIGTLFPQIDVALIGAGAYAPTWFMAPNHQDPYDAVRVFHDSGAKTFIPFHYGTFDSADEPLSEPEKILRKLEEEGKIRNQLKILKLGSAFTV